MTRVLLEMDQFANVLGINIMIRLVGTFRYPARTERRLRMADNPSPLIVVWYLCSGMSGVDPG